MRIEVLRTKKGLPTLKIYHGKESFFVHSIYDPLREAQTLTEKFKGGDSIVVFGAGLGYVLKFFREKYKKVFVVEHPAIFAILKNIFPEILNDERIEYLKNPAAVPKSQDYWFNPVLCRAFPEFFEPLKTLIKGREKITKDTAKKHALNWAVNMILNLPVAAHLPSVLSLKGKVPKQMVLAAAGPSLPKSVKENSWIQESFIMAVDAAWLPLKKLGINPDIVVCVDPQPETAIFLKGFEGILFAEQTVFPEVLKNRKAFLIPSPFPLSLYRGDFSVGFVGGAALKIARELGVEEIVLIGFDFCYIGRRTHAAGFAREEVWLANLNRLWTWESTYLRHIGLSGVVRISGFTTDPRLWYLYLGFLKEAEGLKILNLSKGLPINSTNFKISPQKSVIEWKEVDLTEKAQQLLEKANQTVLGHPWDALLEESFGRAWKIKRRKAIENARRLLDKIR